MRHPPSLPHPQPTGAAPPTALPNPPLAPFNQQVLSVVAKQILTIQTALAGGQRSFVFEGRSIALNRDLAIFITMNPMYQFRNVLPSNLKVGH